MHAILDPKLSYSGEPSEAAFNLAHKTDLPLFEWLSQPEQAYASKRFSIGMHAANDFSAPGIILKGELFVSTLVRDNEKRHSQDLTGNHFLRDLLWWTSQEVSARKPCH